MEIKGRDLVEGSRRRSVISDEEIREALSETVSNIIEAVRVALEQTPPSFGGHRGQGIVLTGGGSLLKNLDKRLREETGLPVSMADDPLPRWFSAPARC
jgi:rod shape-determining protein MreB